ncbi:hypothetical protein BC832DRAFT_545311 [Gaertneriomyces semiglobifer]|nr:hypothetical protein BC832DRAFT_545311 [Gaertneriomyces semiglobifer]
MAAAQFGWRLWVRPARAVKACRNVKRCYGTTSSFWPSVTEDHPPSPPPKFTSKDSPKKRIPPSNVMDIPTSADFPIQPLRRPISDKLHIVSSTPEALHASLRAHDIRRAWNVYKQMSREGKLYKLHGDDHTAILSWLTCHTHPKLAAIFASRVHANMRKYNIALDLRDYHSLMLCHLRNNDPRRVAQLFQKLLLHRIKPDARAYTLMLAAYGQAGDYTAATRIWSRMRAELPGARADMDSWATMIDVCGKVGDAAEAFKLFAELRASKARIDRKVFEALIRALGAGGHIEAAFELFKELKDGKHGTTVDLETYDAIIAACEAADDRESARKLWSELLEFCGPKSHVPLASTFTRLLSICAEDGEAALAITLFEGRSRFYPPDLHSYQSVIWALLKCERWADATEWYERLVSEGYMPDANLVHAALAAKRKVIA